MHLAIMTVKVFKFDENQVFSLFGQKIYSLEGLQC